jgi:micrococcal nuclease
MVPDIVAGTVLSIAALAAVGPARAAPCALAAAAEAVAVERAVDGDTLALDDGREVRLAGVAAPKPPLGADAAAWPLHDAARRALEDAAAGRVLELRPVAASPDRHGRVVGHLTEIQDRDHAALAAGLLARGMLRVAADPAGRDCRATLAAAEDAAIRARLGLWSDPYYEVRDARNGAAFAALSGRFVVAEGRVASVRTSSGRAYVNFGRRWRGALSLSLSEAALRKLGGFEGLGIRSGARLRARRVVELRLGPTIYVTDPAQIEPLDGRKR